MKIHSKISTRIKGHYIAMLHLNGWLLWMDYIFDIYIRIDKRNDG